MKKHILILITGILSLGSISCSSDDDNNSSSIDSLIVGKWKPVKETDINGKDMPLSDCFKGTHVILKTDGKSEQKSDKDIIDECTYIIELGEYNIKDGVITTKVYEGYFKEYTSKSNIITINETTLIVSTFWSSEDGDYPEKYITTNEYTRF